MSTPLFKKAVISLALSLCMATMVGCQNDNDTNILNSSTQVIDQFNESNYGDHATQTALTLARSYAGRYMGSDTERAAAQYVQQRMTQSNNNSQITVQSFEFTGNHGDLKGKTITSENVILKHQGTANTGKTLYVGAHYDSATAYEGFETLQALDDNASGVGVLTELANRFADVETEHDIVFIAFGAEEGGLKGSKAFVDSLTTLEISNAIGMINLDSLITGDKIYANAGANAYDNAGNEVAKNVQLREAAHRIAQSLGIDLQKNPGIIASGKTKPYKPAGVGCCSDHESFEKLMPVVAFEATNWSLGPDFDGYKQTDNPAIKNGYTWHNPKLDNEAVLTDAFGEARIPQRMHDFTQILAKLIAEEVNAK